MTSVQESSIHSEDATIALQPILDLRTGEIGFFESTLRVTRTTDPIFHVRLLTLAEELGFIHYIDLHVLGIVVDTLRRNPEMHASFNVSQKTILDGGRELICKLAASQVTDRLIVEITETAQIPTPWVSSFADGVREVGCRLAIDDFETGFADEVLVRAVKPDLIKVVVDDTTLPYRERVMRCIALANEIGAEVVGEKIDSEEKIELLKVMGVRYLQGFALSAPIMHRDLPGFFARAMHPAVPINDGSASIIRLDLPRGIQPIHGHRQVCLVEETGS